MRVTCILCDTEHEIDDHSQEVKQLHHSPLHTYMCPTCYDRIAEKTKRRREQSQKKSSNGNHSVH